MDKIIIFTERTLNSAPRVIRQIDLLKNKYEIHTVGYCAPSKDFATFKHSHDFNSPKIIRGIQLVIRKITNNFLLFRYSKKKEKKIENYISSINPTLIFVHDASNLMYFSNLKVKFKYKLIFNAHEYYPLEFNDRKYWENTWQIYYENIYNKCLPNVDLFINVCESIRLKCIEEFNKDSIVIPNAAFYNDIEIHDNSNTEKIKIIHHGAALNSRKIEWMIEAVKNAGEKYQLTLMLTGEGTPYYSELENLCKNSQNIKIVKPVNFNEIIPFINKFDIGLYLLPPTNFNNSIALPNKIFEFIQAKLCIVIGPSIEMSRLVNENNLGLVAKDNSINELTNCLLYLDKQKIQSYKLNAKNCSQKLSAENFNSIYLNALESI